MYSSPLLRCRQTAAQLIQGLDDSGSYLQVQVEHGLMESVNESWYRSWSLPESNGTWGFIPEDGSRTIDPETLHDMAKQPIQKLLDHWKSIDVDSDEEEVVKIEPKNYTEYDRLAYPVSAIENECQLIPCILFNVRKV